MSRRSTPFIVAGVMLGAACAKSDEGGSSSFGDYPAPKTESSGDVIAEVGPVVFTTGEMERRLRDLSPYIRRRLQDPEQLERWVENEIRLEAIAQRAWAEGVQDDPEIRKRMKQILVETYSRRAMEKAMGGLEPNDAELLAAYEAREAEFNKPAKVRLSQIVRFVEGPAQRRKARRRLERIRQEVLEGQKKNDHSVFARAAKEHSEDEATKLGAGDLQFLTRDQLTERYGQEVADASFDEAKVGDLYIADAPNAVVLFKKTGRRRAIERSLEQVRPQLRNQLIQAKRQEAFDTWSSNLLERHGVAIDQDAIARIQIAAPEPPTPAVKSDEPPAEEGGGLH